MAARGRKASSSWISRAPGKVNPEEAMMLGLSPGAPVLRFARIRYADDEPMALEFSTIAGYCLASVDVVQDSLYDALEKAGNRPVRALQRLRAVPFGGEHGLPSSATPASRIGSRRDRRRDRGGPRASAKAAASAQDIGRWRRIRQHSSHSPQQAPAASPSGPAAASRASPPPISRARYAPPRPAASRRDTRCVRPRMSDAQSQPPRFPGLDATNSPSPGPKAARARFDAHWHSG